MVFVELARRCPGRVVVLAPWRALIDQTVETFRACGVDAAAHMAGRPSTPARVQVASIETLARRPLPPADLVIVDEAHRADTKPRRALIERTRARSGVIFGCTATPWTDRGRLNGYQVPIVGPSPAELVRRGMLRAPRFYLEDHTQTLERIDAKSKAVLFYGRVDDSRRAAQQLRAAGYSADHLDGETRGQVRADVFEGFRRGSTKIVTNCAVLTEGFDETIDLVGLRPGAMNLRLYVQAIGRGIRPNGDQEAAVSDPAGLCATYGSPIDLPWPLWTPEASSRPSRRAPCPRCSELVVSGTRTKSHACRDSYATPPPAELGAVASQAGLGPVWQAEQWAARGTPWRAGRAEVLEELRERAHRDGLGAGWISARLLALGL